MLVNGNFELEWNGDHRCHIFPVGGDPYFTDVGNIFVPPGWTFWFRHDPGTWDQPEGRDAWKANDPNRVLEGEKAYMYFTFYRRHDAGLYQQIEVQPGAEVWLAAHAHAWSNHNLDGYDWCDGDPACSCGVGTEKVLLHEGDIPGLNGDPWNDAMGNFLFQVGIDATGGTDPDSPAVVWGEGVYVYNGYFELPGVGVMAQSNTITVFLRSTTLWAFRNNDAYWDSVSLEVNSEPTICKGTPRVEYDRTYILLSPDADSAFVEAVASATWTDFRFTFGGSADDAGIGDLVYRRIIALNPEKWNGDLEAFYEEYYPGIEYVPLYDCTTENVGEKLVELLNPQPPQPTPEILLWQCDEPWRGLTFGGDDCTLTFCGAGCYAVDMAMAQRFYGIDPEATPLTVNETLGPDGFDECDLRWSAVPKLGMEILGKDGAEEHLAAGMICLAEVLPASYQHFVLVTKKEGDRYWMYDPYKNVADWLDNHYDGVESWRLVAPLGAPPDPPEPPAPVRKTHGHVGLHLQTMVVGVEEFVTELKPPVMKVLASMHDVVGVKRWSPDTTLIYRLVDNDQGPYLENPDPMTGARLWVDRFRDSLHEIVGMLEPLNLAPPYFYVESLNETYPSLNNFAVARAANFDEAFCYALAEEGLPVAPAVYCAAVGNPHETEYHYLLPVAKAAAETGGIMGYHNYWWANPQQSGLLDWWEYHAGRWQYVDDLFTQNGHYLRWYGGESGAVGSRDGYGLLPMDGWKSGECYAGDWDKYLSDILETDRLIAEWNETHGDRYIGFVLFTTGEGYTGWGHFQIQHPEMADIKTEILRRYQ